MKLLISSFAALLMACSILPAADDPLETNSDSLRAAVEGKKSTAEIKRLAVLVLSEAKKTEAAPAPADGDKANWDARVKYAEQVAEYAEYALYSSSVGAPMATQIDLISTLETESPKSKYLTQDAYLAIANAAMTAQQADRAASFARKSLTAPKGTKPEAQTADAHYIIGIVAATKHDLATADKELRAALPGIKGNSGLEGPAYFYLGEADYSIGRQAMDRLMIDQGIKYTLQSASIPGQFQANASVEAKRMKNEVGEK